MSITQHIVDLCTSPSTVTSSLTQNPDLAPHSVPASLYKKPNPLARLVKRVNIKGALTKGSGEGEEDGWKDGEREMVVRCGNWGGKEPSELFLKIYRDVLLTLDRDPMIGCVSPPLLGSNGTIPLTIVSVIPDIMRHYGSVLSRASSEVILCTNYWEPSASSDIIADSLRTLSKRMQDAGDGRKAVVKLMYDRGTPKQVVENHTPVKPEDWGKVKLPSQEEIPGIDMEVINFHRPLLGTFHSKYMVVDRKVAVLSSNNIQDRPNVEMMIHLEGPIVDSFFDMALLSWHNKMVPGMPSLVHPPGQEPSPASTTGTAAPGENSPTNLPSHHSPQHKYAFGKENPWMKDTGLEGQQRVGAAREELRRQHEEGEMHGEEGVGGESVPGPARQPQQEQPTTGQANDPGVNGQAAQKPAEEAKGAAANDQTDDAEVEAVDEALFDGEGGKETPAHIAQHLDIKTHVDPTVTTLDGDDFRPHILHKDHAPFPIAMVNRAPHGTPGHEDVRVPQDAAWLAALRYARQKVFIQTPTFNATPVIPATLDACRRGVVVTLYVDLGFNDQGEQIPGQGGTNEQVVSGMYKSLREEGKGAEHNFKVYWYTSKDQVSPLNAKAKQRNCHVKFMSVDDQIAILGNGNQDTQSWFHSQEINVLVDAPQLIAEWHQGLNANQNTRLYGLVDEDGIWRYREGKKKGQKLETLGERNGSELARLKGLAGAVKRAQGKGGF
ncbi:hypothetical protein CALCODRAFT_483286 [Calocera cornea HHB12733]|uniref:PLD phosphodiesterase domain-containing protein n=1 Tax=Calocera cornea HHB12733 TaxID=1353952 RepID=A0A165FXX3_9BASI|nr:hypothetical protein CALCODRAFT_483286 [Calocera cornea HHB12733]